MIEAVIQSGATGWIDRKDFSGHAEGPRQMPSMIPCFDGSVAWAGRAFVFRDSVKLDQTP